MEGEGEGERERQLTSGRWRPSLRNFAMFFNTTDWNCWWVRSRQTRRISGGPNLHVANSRG